MYHVRDLDNPSDEGKHILGLVVSDSLPFLCPIPLLPKCQKQCQFVSVYVRVTVYVCVCVGVYLHVYVCGKYWKRCQLDVGVQTDGRQASGQLAFTAFQKPFTPTTSSLYPHSVILAFARLLFFSSFSFLLSVLSLAERSEILKVIIK